MPIPIDVSQGYVLPTPAAVISICVYLKLNVSRNESVLFPNERWTHCTHTFNQWTNLLCVPYYALQQKENLFLLSWKERRKTAFTKSSWRQSRTPDVCLQLEAWSSSQQIFLFWGLFGKKRYLYVRALLLDIRHKKSTSLRGFYVHDLLLQVQFETNGLDPGKWILPLLHPLDQLKTIA